MMEIGHLCIMEEAMISGPWLEWIGALAGLAGVWLTSRRSIWCFPIGLISVLSYTCVFLNGQVRLYADALLQLIFALLLLWGWWRWKKNTAAPHATSHTPMSQSDWLFTAASILVVGAALGLMFSRYTAASYPWLDAGLTAASLAAQAMIALRKRENWLVWIAVDAIYVPMYIQKQLYLTAGLYMIFLALAIHGWRTWKNEPETGRA